MRIGLVTDFYRPWVGGPATLLYELSQGLASRGHAVPLLAPSATGRGGTQWEGSVCVTRVATVAAPFGYDVRFAPLPLRAVRMWLRRIRPDVVHVHHPFPISASVVLAARHYEIPVVATNHTIPLCSLWGIRDSPAYRPARVAFGRWLTFLMNRCDKVATPTETAASYLRDLGFHREIHTISNGVDTRRFKPGAAPDLRRRLALDDRPVVLYTGRLDAEKEMDVWLRAAADLRVRMPAQFVVGGRGADEDRLRHLARRLGLLSDIHFVGYLSDDDFPSLYRVATVYLITSPVELQSISTLEALATGVPVVSVSAGALPELVKDGVTGLSVPPGDSAAAASAVEALLRDEPRRRRMGASARDLAVGHDLQVTVDRYEELLTRAAHGARLRVKRERTGIAWV